MINSNDDDFAKFMSTVSCDGYKKLKNSLNRTGCICIGMSHSKQTPYFYENKGLHRSIHHKRKTKDELVTPEFNNISLIEFSCFFCQTGE